MRIDNDITAIERFLDGQNIHPGPGAYVPSEKYRATWQKRQYSPEYAAKATEWAWVNGYRDTRAKRVDSALGEAVLHDAASRYQFGISTDSPCQKCQFLGDLSVNPSRGRSCDRLLIWVADPSTSTCPEFVEQGVES